MQREFSIKTMFLLICHLLKRLNFPYGKLKKDRTSCQYLKLMGMYQLDANVKKTKVLDFCHTGKKLSAKKPQET